MSSNEMTAQVTELKELRNMAQELADAIAAIEDTLKAEMTAQEVEELTVGCHKIRYTAVSSTRLNTAAIKKAMPEVYALYSKTSTARRFSVV